MTAARRIFPGWFVVGAGFVILATSSGLGFYGLAVYLEAVTSEKGFATGPASLASSLFFVVSGITGRLLGGTLAKRDVRGVVVAGAVVGGAALAVLGSVEELWQFYAVYAVFAIGFAAAGLLPVTTVVTRWFHRRRSIALSVTSTGLSVGGLTLTKLASSMIDSRGLADSTPWLGAVYVLLIVPPALLFLWPDPAAKGWAPDGERAAPAGTPITVPLGVTYDVAVHSRFFVMVTLGYVGAMAAQVGGITQIVKLVTERTGDRSTGALAVSLLALASVVARLLGGFIAPKLPMARLTWVLASVQATSLVLLALGETEAVLLGASVLFGATVGNLLMLQPLLLAEAFGVREYPRLFGLNQLIVTAGVAAGPYLLGAIHDLADYRVAYLVGAAVSVSGAVCIALAGSVENVHRTLWPSTATVAAS